MSKLKDADFSETAKIELKRIYSKDTMLSEEKANQYIMFKASEMLEGIRPEIFVFLYEEREATAKLNRIEHMNLMALAMEIKDKWLINAELHINSKLENVLAHVEEKSSHPPLFMSNPIRGEA